MWQIGYVLATDEFLREGTPLSYRQLDDIEADLNYCSNNWEETGLIKAEPSEPPPTDEREQIMARLAEVTEQKQIARQQLVDIANRYRVHDPDGSGQAFDIKEMVSRTADLLETIAAAKTEDITYQDIANALRGGREEHPVMSARLVTALLQEQLAASEALEDYALDPSTDSEYYTRRVTEARAVDGAKALDEIEVLGEFQDLPFSLNETEVRDFLLKNLPPIALQHVKRLELRPLTPEEKTHDRLFGFFVYDPDLKVNKIVISTEIIKDIDSHYQALVADKEDHDLLDVTTPLGQVLHVLTHEFAHALHSALPPQALRRWAEAADADPIHITSYVKERFDEDHPHKYMEDFADSLGMFVNDPGRLLHLSSARSKAMKTLFSEFLPGYHEGLRRDQLAKMGGFIALRGTRFVSDEDLLDLIEELRQLPD